MDGGGGVVGAKKGHIVILIIPKNISYTTQNVPSWRNLLYALAKIVKKNEGNT